MMSTPQPLTFSAASDATAMTMTARGIDCLQLRKIRGMVKVGDLMLSHTGLLRLINLLLPLVVHGENI
jgi:hypothetical protein